MNPPPTDALRLTTHQQLVVVILSILLLLFIVYLVRRRAIREEYSILWLAAGIFIVIATVFYDVTIFIARLFGAVAPTTAVFSLGILFLVVLNIQMTVVLSRQTAQINRMTRELALLSERLEQVEGKQEGEIKSQK